MRLALLTMVFAALASAAEPSPSELKIQHEGTDEIRGLSVDLGELNWDPARKSLKVSGAFARKDWSLVMANSILVSSEANHPEFEFEAPLTGDEAILLFMAVGPTGETEMSRFRIFREKKIEAGPSPAPSPSTSPSDPGKHLPWSTGLSVTRVNYEQTGTFEFSEWALTLRAGYTHVFSSKRWEMGLSGFGTLMPFGASAPAGFTDASLRFIGINARVGYRFFPNTSGWSGGILAGGYFTTTTYGGTRAFGFRNLAGPQIYPVISKVLGGARPSLIGGYLKFSPVAEDLSLLTLSNREMALGVFWRWNLASGHPFGYSLDWSNLKLSNTTTSINVTTISLGVGYWF